MFPIFPIINFLAIALVWRSFPVQLYFSKRGNAWRFEIFAFSRDVATPRFTSIPLSYSPLPPSSDAPCAAYSNALSFGRRTYAVLPHLLVFPIPVTFTFFTLISAAVKHGKCAWRTDLFHAPSYITHNRRETYPYFISLDSAPHQLVFHRVFTAIMLYISLIPSSYAIRPLNPTLLHLVFSL